jgi:hypothetical protein
VETLRTRLESWLHQKYSSTAALGPGPCAESPGEGVVDLPAFLWMPIVSIDNGTKLPRVVGIRAVPGGHQLYEFAQAFGRERIRTSYWVFDERVGWRSFVHL